MQTFFKRKLTTDDLLDIRNKIETVQKLALEAHSLARQAPSHELENRLLDIEMWKTKLNALILEKTPHGKEKLNVIGRRYLRK